MKNQNETKEQLVKELAKMRQRIAELEASDAERVRAQEALRESEEKARAQYKGIPIPTGTWQKVGEDFVLVDYNDALEEITRGGIADFVGVKARDLHRDRPDIVEGLWRCFAEKTAIEEEMSYRYKSTGERRHLAVRYAFVPPDLVLTHTEDITERVQAQEALRESEQWLSTTLRSIGDAVIATDAQGLVSLMNPVAEELTGWNEAESLGQPLEEVFHIVNEQTGERAESPVTRVLREGVVVGLANHTALIAKDGTKRPIADSGAPMEDEEGNIIGTVMVFRDITERRRAEEEMRIKDNAISSSINAIAISDLQGNLTYVNPAFLDMWGYDDEEEVLGRSALEFWQQTEEAAELMRLVQEGEGGVGELIGVRKDGSVFDAQLSASLVTDDKDEPLCMMASFVDITERKKTEEALKESERRFRDLAGLLPQIVFEMDLEGNITFMNRNGLESLGYTREDLQEGLNALQLVIPEDRERIGQNLQRTFAGERTGGIEYTGLRKDGSTFPFIGDSSLIVRDDEPIGLRGIVMDITRRVRAEEALERRVTELRALNAMATIVNQSLEVDEILERAMDEALEQVGVEAAAMLLLDPSTGSGQRSGQGEAGELALVAHRGLSDEFVQTFRRMKLGEGLAGQVAETGQPSILHDLTEYPEALRSYVEAEKIQSAASVPLMGRTGVIGVMNLGAASPEYFDAEGIELLLGLGQQIATGVEKARLSQETFRVVAENANDGILIGVGEGDHVYANQRAAEITGYSVAELLKTSIKDLAHPDEFEKLIERYRKRLAGEPVPRQYEITLVRKDGKGVPIELTAAKTVWRGQPADMIIFRDITERKRAEKALAQRVEELERFHRLAVGRELRMIELKRQVNELSEQLGKELPYDLSLLE